MVSILLRVWKCKTLLVMRLTLLICLFFAFQSIAIEALSQNQRLSINQKNIKIEEIIQLIENKTDYYFMYSAKTIDVERSVNIEAREKLVPEILDYIFNGTNVSYKINGRLIALSKSGEESTTGQQAHTVSGKVTDSFNAPLPGVSVVIKGTTVGVITDKDGKYTLAKVPENATLQFSFVGMKSQEIPIGNKISINVVLSEETIGLDEVVAVGYGTQRKGEVASAITSIKSEDFIKVPTPDAAQMIRGQVAGLAVIKPDANPLSTSQLSLRGTTTLRASAAPLILIDGIPGSLNSISPDEIAAIDVLKDGSAAAIYGTRGTNGVILITTKNVKGEMPTTIEVNTYLSTQKITRKLPMMSADQYREKVALGLNGAVDYGNSTNWLDEITQTPISQVYNVSIRGGNKSTNYTASFEYRDLNGIIKRSNNKIIYPRFEIMHRMLNDKLKIRGGLSGYLQQYFSGSDGGGYNSSVYMGALQFNPTDSPKDKNGDWTLRLINDYSNPLTLLWEANGENKATNMRMFTDVTLTPLNGLEIKYSASGVTNNQVRGYYETKKHESTTRYGQNGYASRGTNYTLDLLNELTVHYTKTLFNNHTFTVLGGYSWMQNGYQDYYMQNWNFPADDYTYNSMQSGQALRDGRANMNSYKSENKLVGYFGRLNYSYKEKYILAVNLRYEGSSKFGANHKWGTFPAASLAWNIKGENFLKGVSVLSSLKIRAGFGITGTEPSSPYMSLNTLSFSDYSYYGNAWIKSIRPNSNPNPDLRWEKKEETNIGLDFGFFENRLTGSIDVYKRDTKDLLWDYTVPSPPYIFSNITANAGSIRNQGVEVSVQAIPVSTGNFKWVTNANYSTNKNKLLTFSNDQFISSDYSDQGYTGSPIQQSTHRIKEGWPIGNFFGYKTIDVDDDGRWIIEGADGKPKPISLSVPSDKKIIGNGLPKHYVNWTNSVTYKNFDLAVTMRGAFGFQIWNSAAAFHASPAMLNAGWNTMEKAFDPVFGKRPLSQNQELAYVSYYIEDGDYWKVDDLTLGYTKKFVNVPWMKSVRIYGSISNLAVITKYSGIDPEVDISGLAPGIDNRYRYPAARTFTIGATFNF